MNGQPDIELLEAVFQFLFEVNEEAAVLRRIGGIDKISISPEPIGFLCRAIRKPVVVGSEPK